MSTIDRVSTHAVAAFRVVIGLLFTLHGATGLFGVPAAMPGRMPFGTWPGWYASVIQLAVGVLVLVGLATRPAALLGSGSMAFAYFTVHQPQALLPMQNGGELAVLLCWSLLAIAAVGPTTFALSNTLRARRTTRDAEAATVQAAQQRPARVPTPVAGA